MTASALRALIVDDEPLARDELVFLLGECGEVEVGGQAHDAASAIAIADASVFDVAFVDLRMPGPDGIALADALARRHPELAVVIVSAHDDGAVQAFDARVLDYLLKPVRLERLQQTLVRVRERQPDRVSDEDAPLTRLAIRRRGAFVVVDIADVIYFEVRDELVWAVTSTDRFALDLTLATIERRVSDERFFRSHRGVLVRLDRIVAIEPSGAGTFELLLDHPDEPRVPLARDRARTLKQLIPVAG